MSTITCTNCGKPLTPQQVTAPCPQCGSLDRNLKAEDRVVLEEKARVARELANKHYQVEPGLTRVIRCSGSAEVEAIKTEPIKLLEINQNTVSSGILMPLRFGPVVASGITLPSVIMEVTPEEYEQIKSRKLKLPKGWETAEDLPKPPEVDNGHPR